MEGLSALAKMLVCVVGLFFVPGLTRKFARELALPVGEKMMDKSLSILGAGGAAAAFAAPKVMGLTGSTGRLAAQMVGSGVGHATRGLASGLLAASDRVSPLGLKSPSVRASQAALNLAERADSYAQSQKYLREAKKHGVTPWTAKKEKELQGSFGEKKEALQMDKDQWNLFSHHMENQTAKKNRDPMLGPKHRIVPAAIQQAGRWVGSRLAPKMDIAHQVAGSLIGGSSVKGARDFKGAESAPLNVSSPSIGKSVDQSNGGASNGVTQEATVVQGSAVKLYYHESSVQKVSQNIDRHQQQSRLKRMRRNWGERGGKS